MRNFLPSIGRLVRYREPAHTETVRVDSGVVEGSEISMFYDPMIAKLVTYGADREAAIREMRAALDAFYIRGINHNMSFLAAVTAHPRFREGRITTNFIAEEFPEGFQGRRISDAETETLVAVAAFLDQRQATRGGRGPGARNVVVMLDREVHPLRLMPDGEALRVEGRGKAVAVDGTWAPGAPLFVGRVDGVPLTVQVDTAGVGYRLTHDGAVVGVRTLRPRVAELAALMPVKEPPDLSKFLLSPMPGLLVSLTVKEGQEVKAGEELAVVEAMKMENVLRAETDGTVGAIHAEPGASLAVDQAILEFE
jgi:propionyl-CoA carboxylase alpha chain